MAGSGRGKRAKWIGSSNYNDSCLENDKLKDLE